MNWFENDINPQPEIVIIKKPVIKKQNVSDSGGWFAGDLKPPEPKYKPPISNEALKRLLKSGKVPQERWAKNNLYASGIGDDTYWNLNEALFEFWTPETVYLDPFSRVYMEQSTIKHSIHQEHWFAAGLTHPLHSFEGKFKEIRAKFPEYGIVGKIDIILPNVEYLKILGAKPPDKKSKKQKKIKELKIDHYTVVDIKELDKDRFDELPKSVSKSYVTQISLYYKWVVEQGICPVKSKPALLYLDRNKPDRMKWVEITPNQKCLDDAFNRADEFWDYVRKRKFKQDGSNFALDSDWIESRILEQPDREWNPLAEI